MKNVTHVRAHSGNIENNEAESTDLQEGVRSKY